MICLNLNTYSTIKLGSTINTVAYYSQKTPNFLHLYFLHCVVVDKNSCSFSTAPCYDTDLIYVNCVGSRNKLLIIIWSKIEISALFQFYKSFGNCFFFGGGGYWKTTNLKRIWSQWVINRGNRKETQAFEANLGVGEEIYKFLLCPFFDHVSNSKECKEWKSPRGKTITISKHKQFRSAVGWSSLSQC